MLLTESHSMKKTRKNAGIWHTVDDACYRAKNLHNRVNYLIRQSSRICHNLSQGKELKDWESEMLSTLNEGITRYNEGRKGKTPVRLLDGDHDLLTDAYFFSWHLKHTPEYTDVPYAACSQICIQEVCRNWKSYTKALTDRKKHPKKYSGMPEKPGYLDKKNGRAALVIAGQRMSLGDKGYLCLPGFLAGLKVRPKHKNIRQARIMTERDRIRIDLIYEAEEAKTSDAEGIMGIDLGVNNLMAIAMTTAAEPVLVNGKSVKSINQYYNKRRAQYASTAKKANGRFRTRSMERLNGKRNRKTKDLMHKASCYVVRLAKQNRIGTIVIGRNRGWKQEVKMGNITNQNFVSIPHYLLIGMIRYKAALAGIRMVLIDESYTSGTSWLDGEAPVKANYDKSRREHRGAFCSNKGLLINADINAAYQMIEKAGYENPKPRMVESITLKNVS